MSDTSPHPTEVDCTDKIAVRVSHDHAAVSERPLAAQTVCVVGLGYIGLPLSAVLASRSVRVHGVDVRPHVIESLNRGEAHIFESGLAEIVESVVERGFLSGTPAPVEADVFVIAVPTPFTDDHAPDLTYVRQASQAIAPLMKAGNLVVLESTSPVGTAEQVSAWIQKLRPDLVCPVRGAEIDSNDPDRIYVAYCPERVLPGQIIRELVENDRVVGGVDPESAAKGARFYEGFVTGRVLRTDSRTAEMCKLTENAYRDVNIAFANEISLVCDKLGVDPFALIEFANHHPRVNVLQPGPGVGGHCIAVDPWFIVHSAPEVAHLIRTAREVNDQKPAHVVRKVREAAEDFGPNACVACLGLAFKANVDDLRESPAVEITRALAERNVGRILAVEPFISCLPPELAEAGVELTTLDSALARADVIVLLVNHTAFLTLDRDLLRTKRIIDTRGAWR